MRRAPHSRVPIPIDLAQAVVGPTVAPARSDGTSAREGMPDTTDFELLGTLARKAQEGDSVSYEALLDSLYTYVRKVLAARLGSFADLDDLTQECLMGVHKSLLSYHPSRNIRPWIHAIIRYKIADYFRVVSRRKESALTEDIVDLASYQAETSGSANDGILEAMDVHALLNGLPAPLNRAVVLTKFDGLSCEEAARREEISEPALRKRISRAYGRLASLIGRKLEAEIHGR